MKNSVYVFIISLIVGFIVGGLMMKGCSKPNVIKSDTVTITDTLWKDTVITEKELVPKIIVKKKVDTLYLENGDTMQLITESKEFEKRLISDKDTADVKVYTTGINTSLDSLKMRLRTHSVTNYVEVTKYVERKKRFVDRFHLGIQGGLGYGIVKKNVDIYVGVGGSFDL